MSDSPTASADDRAYDASLAALACELRNPLAPMLTGEQLLRHGADDPQAVGRAVGMIQRQARHLLGLIDRPPAETLPAAEHLAAFAFEFRPPLLDALNAALGLRSHASDPRLVGLAADAIGRQVRLLVRLADLLMDAARLARGRVGPRRERLDLASAVRSWAEGRQAELTSSSVTPVLEVPAGPAWVLADAGLLAQAFAALLHEASGNAGNGGQVTVRLASGDGEARVTAEADGAGTEIGRPREGLGVFVARGIVELHGGRVEVSGGPDRCVLFAFRLPLDGPGPPSPEA